jgi:DNA-binding response OmpR family regulator
MVSAKGEVFDKVLGLKMGADDYIVKPFDANELSARVSAVLRRSQIAPATPAAESGDFISYDKLVVNITNYTVTYNGENVELPPKELELLYFIASSPNQVFTRDQLLDSVWGYDFSGDSRTVDVHVKRLREKFTNEDTNWSIATVWGVGYKFEVR